MTRLAAIVDRVGVELCVALDMATRDPQLAPPLHAAIDELLGLMFLFLSSPDLGVTEAVVAFATEYVARLRRAAPAFLAAHVDNIRLLLRIVAAQLRYPD